jgi:hypothetical protein
MENNDDIDVEYDDEMPAEEHTPQYSGDDGLAL